MTNIRTCYSYGSWSCYKRHFSSSAVANRPTRGSRARYFSCHSSLSSYSSSPRFHYRSVGFRLVFLRCFLHQWASRFFGYSHGPRHRTRTFGSPT